MRRAVEQSWGFEVKLGTARINVGRIGCGGMCLETACRRFEASSSFCRFGSGSNKLKVSVSVSLPVRTGGLLRYSFKS